MVFYARLLALARSPLARIVLLFLAVGMMLFQYNAHRKHYIPAVLGSLHDVPRSACEQKPESVAFFQVFVKDVEVTTRIVKEQLQMLDTFGVSDRICEVVVTIVGPLWDHPEVHALLKTFPKVRVANTSQPVGSEPLSLSLLYRHCRAHSGDNVLYMHTKGAYTVGVRNERFRRALMHAVTSECCPTVLEANKSDVCGMRFSPVPHAHYPGNMWWARCDYIAKLYDPLRFERAMGRLAGRVFPRECDRGPFTGTWRYASEHWIGSHPSVRTSDVMDYPIYRWNYESIPIDLTRWKMDCLPFFRKNPENPRAALDPATHFIHSDSKDAQWPWREVWPCSALGYKLGEYRDLYGRIELGSTACIWFNSLWNLSMVERATNEYASAWLKEALKYKSLLDRCREKLE